MSRNEGEFLCTTHRSVGNMVHMDHEEEEESLSVATVDKVPEEEDSEQAFVRTTPLLRDLQSPPP